MNSELKQEWSQSILSFSFWKCTQDVHILSEGTEVLIELNIVSVIFDIFF